MLIINDLRKIEKKRVMLAQIVAESSRMDQMRSVKAGVYFSNELCTQHQLKWATMIDTACSWFHQRLAVRLAYGDAKKVQQAIDRSGLTKPELGKDRHLSAAKSLKRPINLLAYLFPSMIERRA